MKYYVFPHHLQAGGQPAHKNVPVHLFPSPVVLLQISVFGRTPETPHLLCILHPTYDPILHQRPHTPVRFRIWVRGTEEHCVRDHLVRKLHVAMCFRMHQLISTCPLCAIVKEKGT